MARNPSTRWYSALVVLIIFVLLAWLLGSVLTLTTGERVALQVGLVTLGLIAAGALLWYLRPQQAALPATADKRDADVSSLVAAARSRLPRGAFDSRKLVLLLGPEGSCKSTLVIRSGTDPELLAGDVPSGTEMPRKTALANLWLTKEAVLAEAGGPVFSDAALWQRLVRALRPPRLAAALGRANAVPRAAVLCVSCDLFTGPNAREQTEALAKLTRERLTEAARAWGVAVPVYVFFTKADRIAHFEKWAGPLDREEVRAVVGSSLPFDATASASGGKRAQAAGTYSERIVPRVETAFARIVADLASHRLDLLSRESQPELRLAAYELPREVGKFAQAASRFLVEICRPVHVGVSPQLRGFYLVGARPVVVSDVPPAAAARPAAVQPVRTPSSATHVFVPQQVAPAASPAAAAQGGATRRVPQWVFLERLFPEVVFADTGASAMARGGVRVAMVRRALLGAGIAAALFIAIGVLRSWLGNRALADRVVAASNDVNSLQVVIPPAGSFAFPSADGLRRLEGLRVVLDTLKQYSDSGVPNRLGWGLWRGDKLLAAGRRVWLGGYERQLHTSAYSALLDSLKALPDTPRPTDEYGQDYAMLKAYLVMTNESKRSTADFLEPVLVRSWARGQTIDADVLGLARRQFDFYATLLADENPWPQPADARVVNRTRTFLNGFTGEEQIYQYLIAQADKAVPAVKLSEAAPQAAGFIAAPPEMSGAFTADGWTAMQRAFRESDTAGEPWVVGDATAANTQDRDKIMASLAKRYQNDYVQRWRTYVRAITVVRPSGGNWKSRVQDGAKKVGAISGAQSPLLAVLAMVSRNTDVDSSVSAAFQPVHLVVPPTAKGTYLNEGNQQYVGALVGVQGALEQITYLPEPNDTASAMALAQKAQESLVQVSMAKGAARQLAQKFAVDTAAVKLGPPMAALLEAPIVGAEDVLRGVAGTRPPSARVVAAAPPPPPPSGGGGGGGGGGGDAKEAKAAAERAALNERGRAICTDMTPMLAKFPFNPDATVDATLAEVTALLAPESGSLFLFEKERLGEFMEKKGGQWVKKGEGPVALAESFITFFNRAARVSDALFDGNPTPKVVFTAKGETSNETPVVTLTQGDQKAVFTKVSPPSVFEWPSRTGREARLLAVFGKEKERLVERTTGEWAMFRLIAKYSKGEGGGASLRAEWNATGKGARPVAINFKVESGAPVFTRGWLGDMSCSPQVTR